MSKKQMTIPIFVPHLGCPHQCSFCNQNEISGQHFFPHRDFIINQVESYLESSPDSLEHIEIAFFGGSFTGIDRETQESLLSTAMEFKNSDRINGIRLSTRPDYIDRDRLSLLKEYKVDTIELGVQSFCDDVLEKSGRGHSSADIFNGISLLKEFNFNFGIQLMPGLPGDNFDKSLFSAHEAAKLNPYCVRIYPTIVLKNTPLEKMYLERTFIPLSLDEAVNISAHMLDIFYNKNIPVIRIGLHPLNKEEEKNFIAGPYKHNFGFLAKSRLKRNILEKELDSFLTVNKVSNLMILIPQKDKEEFIGLKKENIIYLKNKFNRVNITYKINNNNNNNNNNNLEII